MLAFEAEATAFTVLSHYGIESDAYSFGYIAGWSKDQDTPELKASLETIRATASEMIEAIDAQLQKISERKQEKSSVLEELNARKASTMEADRSGKAGVKLQKQERKKEEAR